MRDFHHLCLFSAILGQNGSENDIESTFSRRSNRDIENRWVMLITANMIKRRLREFTSRLYKSHPYVGVVVSVGATS